MFVNLARIFKKEEETTATYLVLDVGSSSLKAAVFSPLTGKKVALLSYKSQPEKAGAVQGGMIVDVAAVAEVAGQVVEEAALTGGGRPLKVICGLSGEAVKDFYTSVRLSRENADVPLLEKELGKLAEKIREVSFLEIERELTEVTGSAEREGEVISTRLANFKVDGYPLSEPLGFTGKVLEVALGSAVAPATYVSRLKSVLQKLKLPRFEMTSQLAAVTSFLKKSEGSDFNALLVEVGGEKTDVAVVFGGNLIGSRTFGLGGAHFTRTLREKLSLKEGEAEEKKLAYSRRELAPEEMEKIRGLLAVPLNFWLKGLEVTLTDFSGVKTFPDKVWLWGGGSLLPDIAKALQAFPWTVTFPFLAPPRVAAAAPSLFLPYLEDRRGQDLESSELLMFVLGLWPMFREGESNVDRFFRV